MKFITIAPIAGWLGGTSGNAHTISGRISDDGSYSFTVSETVPTFDDPERRHNGPASYTTSYESTGNMASDAYGNIVVTPDTGGSFVWLLQ